MKTIKIALLLVSTVFLFTGLVAAQPARGKKPAAKAVAKKAPPTAGEIARSGSFEDGVYKNELLGFNITIPEGWELTSDTLNEAGMDASRSKVLANRSRQMATAMDQSFARTRVLFQTIALGGGITSGVETLAAPMTQQVYLTQNKQIVLSTHAGSKVTKDMYAKTIGGAAFTAFEVEIPRGDQMIRQIYMVTRRRNVMFFFVLTHMNDEAKKTLLDSIDTLKLDK